MAAHLLQRRRVRRLLHLALGVQQVEEQPDRRHLHEEARDEAGQGVEAADQQVGEADEADDLADRHLPRRGEPAADGEDDDHDDGRRRVGEDREEGPPGQHGILRRQQFAHQRLQFGGLGAQAREALHHGDVADDVADPPEHLLVAAFDPRLPRLGAADDEDVHRDVDDRQDREQSGEAGVHEDRRRRQQRDADHRRLMLAEEAEPDHEERVGAGQHGADDAAGPLAGMVGRGQVDRALEGVAHRRHAAAMRQPVGEQGDDDPGRDAADAEHRPERHQFERLPPVGERVDDPAEQDRLGEVDDGDDHVRDRQAEGGAPFGLQQCERTQIGGDERHVAEDRAARNAPSIPDEEATLLPRPGFRNGPGGRNP